jgi:hypothetical protein
MVLDPNVGQVKSFVTMVRKQYTHAHLVAEVQIRGRGRKKK